MPRQRHRQLAGGDAAAIVAHPHQSDAAALDVDLDARRAGVECVLDELLDHRGGPLDHLAGGDLVDELAGKNADPHGGRSLQAIGRAERALSDQGVVAAASAALVSVLRRSCLKRVPSGGLSVK